MAEAGMCDQCSGLRAFMQSRFEGGVMHDFVDRPRRWPL
jgi:hypothetical protein